MRKNLLYRALIAAIATLLAVTTTRRYSGLRQVPATGGVLVVCNHISIGDPGVLVHALSRTGRLPRGLATAGLFAAPVVGSLFRAMGHIPVLRGSTSAKAALAPAAEALRNGEMVVMYPEGGISAGTQWPTKAKTGAARLALTAGVPVVPVAQWGIQRVLPPRARRRSKLLRPVWALLTRPRVKVLIGAPFTLSGDPENIDDVRAATARIEAEIVGLLEELRGPRPADHHTTDQDTAA